MWVPGLLTLAVVAILCIAVGAKVFQRRRDEMADVDDDDFDFDAYEGFDKK